MAPAPSSAGADSANWVPAFRMRMSNWPWCSSAVPTIRRFPSVVLTSAIRQPSPMQVYRHVGRPPGHPTSTPLGRLLTAPAVEAMVRSEGSQGRRSWCRRADRPRLGRNRQPVAQRHSVPGTHSQRPAWAGGSAGRRHRDGVRVRGRQRPDQPHLGHTQPRETPSPGLPDRTRALTRRAVQDGLALR